MRLANFDVALALGDDATSRCVDDGCGSVDCDDIEIGCSVVAVAAVASLGVSNIVVVDALDGCVLLLVAVDDTSMIDSVGCGMLRCTVVVVVVVGFVATVAAVVVEVVEIVVACVLGCRKIKLIS